MAAKNEISLNITVNDKGQLVLAEKQTKALAASLKGVSDATETATKHRNMYNKQEKGTAGLTSNSTKSFAKQAQTLGQGLVPAYASLAANVFAVTAAFGALKRAAALEQLEKGLIAVGNAGGRNLTLVADRLVSITDNAISVKDAMESVALGTSAGFSTSQMENLTKVAKGASLALGRDMSDAMSRLTRGAAKLEPEILDELGIMVRLDDVSAAYAKTIGKTTSELTQFEKRMAFTNAIIDQGTKKFGTITETIDPNPYDQLAASFNNLSKAGLNLLNTVIDPIVSMLGSNMGLLAGGVTLFASSVTKQMVPAMYKAAELAADELDLASQSNATRLEQLKSVEALPAGYKKLEGAIKSGTASELEYQKAMNSLDKSIEARTKWLSNAHSVEIAGHDINKQKKKDLEDIKSVRSELIKVQTASLSAEAKGFEVNALQEASLLKLKSTYLLTKEAIISMANAELTAAKISGTTVTAFTNIKIAAKTTALTLKVLGTAFLNAIPYIGLAITAFSVLKEGWDYLTDPGPVVTATNEVIDSFSSFDQISVTLNDTLENLKGSTGAYAVELKTIVGVLDQVASGIDAVVSKGKEVTFTSLNAAKSAMQEASRGLAPEDIEAINKAIKEGDVLANDIINKYVSFTSLITGNVAAKYRNAALEVRNLTKAASGISIETAREIGRVLDEAVTRISSNETLKEVMGPQLAELEKLQKAEITEDTIKRVKKISNEIANLENSFNSIGPSATEFNRALGSAFSTIEKGPLDDVISKFQVLSNNISTGADNVKFLKGALETISKVDPKLAESLSALSGEDLKTYLNDTLNSYKEINVLLKTSSETAKEITAEANKYKKATKYSEEAVVSYYDKLNEAVKVEISALDASIKIRGATEDTSKLEAKRAALLEKLVSSKEIELEKTNAVINLLKLENTVRAKALETELSIINAKQRKSRLDAETESLKSRTVDTVEEAIIAYNLEKASISDKIKAAKEEAAIKSKTIAAEYDLEVLKLKRQIEESKGDSDTISRLEALIDTYTATKSAAETSIRLNLENTIQEANNTLTEASNAVGNAIETALEGISTEAESSNLSDLFKDLDSNYSDVFTAISNMFEIQEEYNKSLEDQAKKKLELIRLEEQLKRAVLGTADAKNLQAQISTKQSELDSQSLSSQVSMYANYGTSVANILNGLADAQDQTSEKGFESAKKMQLAAAVINTAGAITNALATVQPFPAAVAAAAVAAAAGAAQISQIKKTKFGDSGSSSSSSGIASVPVGNSSGKAATTGTVLGYEDKTSESIDNVAELLDSIHSKEYRTLRGIEYAVEDLNNNITGLVSNIVRTTGGDLNLITDSFELGTAQSVYDSFAEGIYGFLDEVSLGTWRQADLITTSLTSWVADLGSSIVSGVFGGDVSTRVKEAGYELGTVSVSDLADGVSAAVEQYNLIKIKIDGGWFGSDKTKYKTVYASVDDGITQLFTNILSNIGTTITELAKGLGDDETIQKALEYVFDIGQINLKDLDPDEIQETLAAVFSTAADVAAQSVLGEIVGKYQQADEGLYETAIRMYATQELVKDGFEKVGITLDGLNSPLAESKELFLEVANAIVEAAGGLEEYQKTFENFFDQFFTDAEKQAYRVEALSGILSDSSLSLPETRAGYKELLQSIDLTSESGVTLYVQLLELTDLAGEYYSYVEGAESDRLDIIKQRSELEIELLEAQGRSAEALALSRKSELESIDESLRSLQELVWAAEDGQKWLDMQVEKMELLGQSTAALNAERGLELLALNSEQRALQEQIYMLQDMEEAMQSVISVQTSYNGMVRSLYDLLGDEASATDFDRANTLAELNPTLHAMQIYLWDVEDATNAVAEAEEALATARENSVSNAIDSLNDKISETQDRISKLTSALSSLNSAQQQLQDITVSVIRGSIQAIRSMASDVASGNYDSLDNLDDNLSILTNDNQDQYAQFEDYQRDFLKAKRAIDDLKSVTEDQLSYEERTLALLEAQLASQQAALDALNNTNSSVISVRDAINNLEIAQATLDSLLSSGTPGISDPTETYLTTKAAQLNEMSYGGRTNWTAADTLQAINDAGLSVYEHYSLYGKDEGLIDPFTGADALVSDDQSVLRQIAKILNTGIYGIEETTEVGRAYGPADKWASIAVRELISELGTTSTYLYEALTGEIPTFASGGYHSGGWRIVGEEGPELEYTGSSQVYNRQQSDALFNMDEVVEELAKLREDIRLANIQLSKNTKDTAKLLSRWDGDGMPAERTV